MGIANQQSPLVASREAYQTRRVLCPVGLALASLVLLLLFASPAMAQDPTPEPEVYVVQPGDTLFTIAQRFGSSVEAIVAANGITNPSLINPGQKLIIPTVELDHWSSTRSGNNARVHAIRPGEVLPALAFRYGTTVWALRVENDLNRLGLLWPGQELSIPSPTAEHSKVPASHGSGRALTRCRRDRPCSSR